MNNEANQRQDRDRPIGAIFGRTLSQRGTLSLILAIIPIFFVQYLLPELDYYIELGFPRYVAYTAHAAPYALLVLALFGAFMLCSKPYERPRNRAVSETDQPTDRSHT